METYEIRRATTADLGPIGAWLAREDDEDDWGGLSVRISNLEDAQRDGDLTVLALPGDEPIAFCVWTPRHIHTFVVRPGYRRRGYCRAVAEHVIAAARATGSPGLVGQCLADAAVCFWRRLGFKLAVTERVDLWLSLPFPRHRELPDASVRVRIALSTTLEWAEGREPHDTRASRHGDGYLLKDEFIEFTADPDARVTAQIDGREVLSVGPGEGEAYGIETHDHWIRIFELRPPDD
jgi:GNAT superfamily N-acetyltransferase